MKMRNLRIPSSVSPGTKRSCIKQIFDQSVEKDCGPRSLYWFSLKQKNCTIHEMPQ
jgi:hypothetical protein